MHMVNLRGIDLNLLTILQSLLAEESVSRAADRLGLSQPAASHALNRLRALFADPLLERHGSRLTRTAFAAALLPRLQQALRAAEAVFAPPDSFDPAGASGTVCLAASDYVSALLLPGVVNALATEAPGLELRVITADRLGVTDALRAGRADLALGVFGTAAPGFRSQTLFSDDFVIVARRGHPILEAPRLQPADLAHHDWALVSPFGDATAQLDEALRLQGLARRVRVSVPTFLQAPQLAAETGLALALGRRLALQAVRRWPLGWRELPLPVAGFAANMMWLEERTGDPLQDWLRARFLAAA